MVEPAIVHVIDDDASVRRSVTALLRSVGRDACDYPSCVEFLDAQLPDVASCLILDVRLPGTSGLDFHRQMSVKGLEMPVIMMTGHGDITMSVQAMKAGAIDFLTKPFRDQDMLDAVNAALEKDHERRLSRSMMSDLVNRHASLSAREKEVMEMVTSGLLNKQAAFALGLSEITVKLYRASAMKKMGARTLADLVKIAERLKG